MTLRGYFRDRELESATHGRTATETIQRNYYFPFQKYITDRLEARFSL